MTEEVKAPEAPVTIDPKVTLPIALTLPEIQGILGALRRAYTMEQAEGLVLNIQAQANSILQQMKQTETGETK